MKKITPEQIIKALEHRGIPYTYSNNEFTLQNPYAKDAFKNLGIGSKIVRITKSRWGQQAIFNGMANTYDEIYIKWVDPKTQKLLDSTAGWQCIYFIPLNWIQTTTKSYQPDWL